MVRSRYRWPQDAIACARIVIPAAARFDVHRAEFPLPARVFDARQKPLLLLRIAYFKPVFDQKNARIDDLTFDQRAVLQESLRFLLGAKPITRSTPARLYQLRSKMTISPAAGKCAT